MPSSEAVPFKTLITIAPDLQIKICTFLHPSDILALRKTCKAFQTTTRQRIVWIEALHRVCLDNILFLPSFPIPDMSDVELEQSAIAPRRWIELCAAFSKKQSNDSRAELNPRTTRIIQDPLDWPDGSLTNIHPLHVPETFLVPGGRYLVSSSLRRVGVWDLGYTSNSDCKLLASSSVGRDGEFYTCKVNTTSDGMGLIIVAFCQYKHCFVYEIYPQSLTPQLTLIAHLDLKTSGDSRIHLLPNRVVWYDFYKNRLVFRIWDYRLNHSISFSADVNVARFDYRLQTIVTQTSIVVLCAEAILVWGIPPLSPQPPDFFDHNPTHLPPLFRVTFPDDLIRKNEFLQWETISSWYSDSSEQPLYFDALDRSLKLQGFELYIKRDLSDVSLRATNTSQPSRYDFNNIMTRTYTGNKICEESLVSITATKQCTVHIRSVSSRPTDVISPGGHKFFNVVLPIIDFHISLCPSSGRLVHLDINDHRIVVVDFL